MTEDQYQKAQEIEKFVTFLPGSYDKRYCQSIASMSKDKELTEKQSLLLENMYHRYRKQIPHHEKKCKICSGEIKPYKRTARNTLDDIAKLQQWTQTAQKEQPKEPDPQLPLFD